MKYFYISFATTEAFLGATVVKAVSPAGAVEEATRLGLNPGGEAFVLPIPKNLDSNDPSLAPFLNRLMGEEEIVQNHGGVRKGDMHEATRDMIDRAGVVVCAECNQD